jgi:hypothetical protein
MGTHISDEVRISDIEPADSAMRRVLENPDVLGCIFDYCDMKDLDQISLVDRFFEAASASRMYRRVVMNAESWRCADSTLRNGTPTPRQIGYLAYARGLHISGEQNQRVSYDLSSCSFAGVKLVQLYPPSTAPTGTVETDNQDRENDQNLAEMLNTTPGFSPDTVVDMFSMTLRSNYGRLSDRPPRDKERPGTLSHSATRLVTDADCLENAIGQQLKSRRGQKKPLLRASYPNLSEIVMWLRCEPTYCRLLNMVFALVENGYKVVLAGYQERSHDKEYIKGELLGARRKGIPKPVPGYDQLVDTLADRVHKISLREFYALPYCGYHGTAEYIKREIKEEERFYRAQHITMRHDSRGDERL